MAISQTTRLGLYRWSAATDEFTREQMDTSHAQLESRAARFATGVALPAHAAEYVQSFFLDTSSGILYYSNGSAWVTVNSFAAPVATIAPGDTANVGTATTISRSDHRHAMLPFATTTSSVAAAAAGGSASTYARGDHQHILGTGIVNSTHIAAGAINSSTMIASNVITNTLIADTAVTRSKIETAERIPTGTIMPFVGSAAPTGWYLCDGQTVVAPGSALGLVMGSRWGTDGGGNYRVPDLRGKFPFGAYTGASWNAVSGGADTVTLTANNLPAHTHAAGTYTTTTVADHTHGSGGLLNANSTVDHTHTFLHTHNVSTSISPDVVSGGVLGTVLAITPTGTGGVYNISTTNGNVGQYSLTKYSTWTADQSASTTTATNSPSTSHTHTLSGSTAANGTHNHTLTGDSGNNTTTGAAVSILPSYTGLNFIIKY